MTLEAFVAIVCMVGAAVSYGLYRYLSKNVYIKYKNGVCQ